MSHLGCLLKQACLLRRTVCVCRPPNLGVELPDPNLQYASAFPEPLRRQESYPDIETMFGALPRDRAGIGALWGHQLDQLRTYESSHMDTADVAMELPTGSGKTLVGLLVAEWRRRKNKARVVYACPTRQLAKQVAAAANRQGIESRLLVDSSRLWDGADLLAYNRAEAIAVTTYSHIFNTNPKFSSAETIIFDDAHAAENYVGDAWAVEVPPTESLFADLFDAFGSSIDPLLTSRMVASGANAAHWNEVRMLPITAVHQRLNELDLALSTGLTETSAQYRFRMIRESLGTCLFYVGRRGWYIRPMIPPTMQHEAFTGPAQRIYLSATLGEAGELERAFGRFPIARIPAPPAWERTGSSRRFFVFPELATYNPATDKDPQFADDEQPDLLHRLGALADKRVVLAQDSASVSKLAEAIGDSGDRIVASDDTVEQFRKAKEGTLLAANRYDGMDLAADACRLEFMSGVPGASHLQDEFLSSKLRAHEVLAERIRTRIVQGTGRCARGPQDWAVVVVHGAALLNYLATREHTASMPVDLQAEIEFGLRASKNSWSNVLTVARSAIEQDATWRRLGEKGIGDHRDQIERQPQPLAKALAASAPQEVQAWRSAWVGRWEEAAQHAVGVMEALTAPDARAYRALWTYLASAWYRLVGNAANDERGQELLRRAHKASSGTVWLREIEPLPVDEAEYDAWDEAAVQLVLDRINRGEFASAAKFSGRVQKMLAGLAQTSATAYEEGLKELGLMLGAESSKPAGKGRADATWVWDDLWITVEAKSEQTTPVLSMDYVRQANTQLASLAADRDEAQPAGSISVISAQSDLVDPDAIPISNENLFLVTADVVLDIARDVSRALTAVRSAVAGVQPTTASSLAAKLLWQDRVLPTQIRERLSRSPIRATS